MMTDVITDIILRFAESSANCGKHLIAVIGANDVIGAKMIATKTKRTIGENGVNTQIRIAITKAEP